MGRAVPARVELNAEHLERMMGGRSLRPIHPHATMHQHLAWPQQNQAHKLVTLHRFYTAPSLF